LIREGLNFLQQQRQKKIFNSLLNLQLCFFRWQLLNPRLLRVNDLFFNAI
jgi:hypothetical protein